MPVLLEKYFSSAPEQRSQVRASGNTLNTETPWLVTDRSVYLSKKGGSPKRSGYRRANHSLQGFRGLLERIQILGRLAYEQSSLHRAYHHSTQKFAIQLFFDPSHAFCLVKKIREHVGPQFKKPGRRPCKILIGVAQLLSDISEKSACLATPSRVIIDDPVDHEFNFFQGIVLARGKDFEKGQVLGDRVFNGGLRNFLFGCEIEVDVSPFHPGLAAYIVDAGPGVSLFSKELSGGLENLVLGDFAFSGHGVGPRIMY